jgi:DNA-binding response OmpR family regulator
MKLLLVEDEDRVADFVARGLKAEGWSVERVSDGETALGILADHAFDVVVLDLLLPGMSGLDVCRTMRARNNFAPVLMLTALDATDERVRGLDAGADDYLPKPFDFGELVARLTALHRRATSFKSEAGAERIELAGLAFDLAGHTVTLDGVPVDLTAKERELLWFFLSQPSRVFSRERILNAVWGVNEDPLTNVVDVYVARLRRKLGDFGERFRTVRGVGYQLAR